MKKAICIITGFLLLAEVCLGQDTPKNLVASWYCEYGRMANGSMFDSRKYTAASWDYDVGDFVIVRNDDSGRSIVVCITDRTARRYKGRRIDLTPAGFLALGGRMEEGLIKVCTTKTQKR